MKKDELFDVIKQPYFSIEKVRSYVFNNFNVNWGETIDVMEPYRVEYYFDEDDIDDGYHDEWYFAEYEKVFDDGSFYSLYLRIGPDVSDRPLILSLQTYDFENEIETVIFEKRINTQSELEEYFKILPLLIEEWRKRLHAQYLIDVQKEIVNFLNRKTLNDNFPNIYDPFNKENANLPKNSDVTSIFKNVKAGDLL
jgi:hypothetical protein